MKRLLRRLRGRCSATLAAAVVFFCAAGARAENWPGYEGLGHRSASAVNISPDSLRVKWMRRFDKTQLPSPRNEF